jgi:alanine dehydrogenase
VPVTATYALTNATLPYVLKLADLGVRRALRECPELRMGINVAGGRITHPAVAEALGAASAEGEPVG